MKISISSNGSFEKTQKFLKKMTSGEIYRSLSRYGQEGVNALSNATPRDSGETANSWSYEVGHKGHTWWIGWNNNHVESGKPIAILLQYGHGTGTGGYVAGRDYINPAIQPIFDKIAEDVWKVVTSA